MENRKLWHPILFQPIIFEEKGGVKNEKKIVGEHLEVSSKPSWCDGGVEVIEGESAELLQQPYAEQKRVDALSEGRSVGVLTLPRARAENVVVSETRQRNPKPYDVARELMSILPLRMVDNALYAYDGKVYRFMTAEVMYRVIMANCRRYVEVVGDASLIERIYKVIQAEPGIVFHPLTNQLRCVALEDGLLDLDTFILHPHSAAPFVTSLLNGSFSRGQGGACPHFSQFLNEVSGYDQALVERIWQMIGYLLVPDMAGKCFFLLQGVPDSGKSLLVNLISGLMDEDTVTSLELSALGERFGASELVGKQLCTVSDMPSGALDSKAVSMFKALTGGDVVTVDVKYQPRIKLRCQAKFILATNHALLTKDYDPALMRRAVVIPFRYSVPKEEQNFDLKGIFLMEKDAIIYNGLQAYQRLRAQRYRWAGYFELNGVTSNGLAGDGVPRTSIGDVLWDFCQQNCVAEEGSFVSTMDLYMRFEQVTGTSFPGGVTAFSGRIGSVIEQMFPDEVSRARTRTGGNGLQERGFKGLNLVSYFDFAGGERHG